MRPFTTDAYEVSGTPTTYYLVAKIQFKMLASEESILTLASTLLEYSFTM
jgi:hypothetical protein